MSQQVRHVMSSHRHGQLVALCALWLLALAVWQVGALCPTNGNTHVVYVTANMGDNIWSFDTQGHYLGEVINTTSYPSDVQVHKLRAMRFGPGNFLYVSSASGSFSRIFAVSGNGVVNHSLQSGCTRDYLFTVVKQDKSNPLLDHPYDIAFHPETNDLFVANQNSVTVTKYTFVDKGAMTTAASEGRRGRHTIKAAYPTWEPITNTKAALPSSDKAAAAAAAVTTTAAAATSKMPDLPDKAGLFASSWSTAYMMDSTRGIALSPRLPRSLIEGSAPPGLFSLDNASMAYYLLVCDVISNVIHVFDAETGERAFGISVPSPIQVVFPSRFYQAGPTVTTANGAESRQYDLPYLYVTSKDNAMAYLIRFTSRSPPTPVDVAGRPTAPYDDGVNGAKRDPDSAKRLYRITHPAPMHAASGLYENPSRDVLLVADRNGRKVSSYASPFLTDYTTSRGPAPFLGYFLKQLPDQPEFIMTTLLETQANIPFCYELKEDGTLRYVALCTAASIWSLILAVVLICVPSVLLYRQIQHCLREKQRRERRGGRHGDGKEPLLRKTRPNGGAAAGGSSRDGGGVNYGTY